MKHFMLGILGGLLAGVTMFTKLLPVDNSHHGWTEEQKMWAVCGALIGVIPGFTILTTAILVPIIWMLS